jgi:EAL domain-containing protein (putative c-di-GMP-specific phosphodiesterase class I)
MRVWEFQDNNAVSADLVREQDFILRVRRMQRQSTPCLVLNFILNAIEPLSHNRGALEAAQKSLDDFARATNGVYYEMSNGDVFLAWDPAGDARILTSRAIENALPDFADKESQFLLTYRMPDNYTALRERTNHYVDAARAAAITGSSAGKIDDSQKKLTAKNLDQIEQLLGEIDLHRYGRTQNIYRDDKGGWQPIGEEYYISFEDLRRERFPKLEVATSEHFFFALCGILDQKLLAMLTQHYEIIGGRTMNLNLSISSIMSSVFMQFVHRVPHAHRSHIGFELHRGDLFQDFPLTISAIEVLKREGFRVALDSLTPDMLPAINLDVFAVDAFKINVSKERAAQLNDPDVKAALKRLAPEKLIFFRCDNERALTAGRELGVTTFQGWLIDDQIKKN